MVCKISPKTTGNNHGVNSDGLDKTQEVVDYDTALNAAGYGRLSRSALGACVCAFFASGVENCVMSYVLPAARCELQLTTYQAGLLNMAFMSGGVASAFFWGIVGDVLGRRNTLSMTLLLDAALTLAQSTVPGYWLLLAARTLNGFIIGGPATLVFPYLSDLVGEKKRQLYLSLVGMSFVVAWLILPAVAWLIIPFKIPDYPTLLPIYSWRLYLALGSVPGFIAGIWVLYLPESPRLLLDTNRSDKALKLLSYIYKTNNPDGSEFKIKKLIQDNILVTKTVNGEENRTKVLFMGVLRDLKVLVSKMYAMKSTLILFVFFCNMAAGFGLNMWIPELMLRMQSRECKTALNSTDKQALFNVTNITWVELIKVGDGYKEEKISINENFDNHDNEQCDATIDAEVFKSGLIVGACCVLGNAACALLCARGGARGVRIAAAACAGACAVACACLAASACGCSNSNKLAVAAAAALNAASLNGNVLLIRLLLHALPPKLSGMAVCWGAWWGRAGGVASNLAVGVLLDYSCAAPFISVGALLAISVGAIMIIKLEENKEDQKLDSTEQDVQKTTGLDRYISTYM